MPVKRLFQLKAGHCSSFPVWQLRALWLEFGTTSTTNAQSSHRPPERPVAGHDAGLAGLVWHDGAVIGALAMVWIQGRGDAREFRHLLWHRRRTGGRLGQRIQLLRDLDQQTGSVKISPASVVIRD